MKLTFFTVLFFVTGTISAQNFEITGRITDETGSALSAATVYLEKPADSSLVTYTISEDNGSFILEGKSAAGNLNLYVSYAGYKPYLQKLSVKDDIELGRIIMKVQDNKLDEITLTARRAPISIKNDTLEFNASSFKTRENANLEEVLKELPGVSVDNDGNITVNGKPVSRILVNGKEFFGDDPKIATRNLPKEIIDKIQVVDTKTKSEEFTGKEGDSENKTINITIEEDKNKGYFTRLTAGVGTDDRYELSGISNYFKGDLRLSLLASSNNINSSGFTFDEVFDAMGRNAYSISTNRNGAFSINGMSYGGGAGITETDNLGFSFVNEWPQKTELAVNYFFNHADNRNETRIERENILPDRRYFVNSSSASSRFNDNHRFSTSFEIQPDTLTRISFRPNFSVNAGESFSNSLTESSQEDGLRINSVVNESDNKFYSTRFSNNLYFTRKFGSKGGSYSIGIRNENENRLTRENFFSEREIYDEEGQLEDTEIQDQFIDEESRNDSYTADLSLRLPVVKNWNIDIGLQYDKEKSKNERLVYDASQGGTEELLIENLSNDFRSELYNIRPSAGIVYNNDTLRFTLSGGLLNTRLKNSDLVSGTSIDNSYDNFYANAYLNYKFTKSKSIYFNYSNRRETPQISQLQPVNITTNPLNIITGNPSLKPSLVNRFYVNFNNYDWAQRTGFFAYASGQFVKDDIVPITITDENLVRTTTYTNADGSYRLYGGVNLDKKFELDSLNTIKFEPGVYANYNKRVGFSNGEKFNSVNAGINPHIELQYDVKDILTLEPYYRMGIVHASYSLNNRTENFINHELNFQATSYWPRNFIIGSDLSYQKFGNISSEFKNSYLLWNASLGYKLLGDDGILKVKVFDILDENTGTQRITGEDFIQDTEELVLERYLMFSFTWKFSKFGGKDPNKANRSFF